MAGSGEGQPGWLGSAQNPRYPWRNPMRKGISFVAAISPRNFLNCARSYHRRRERSEIA